MSNNIRPLAAVLVVLSIVFLGSGGCPFESADEEGARRHAAPSAPPSGLVVQESGGRGSMRAGQAGADEEDRCPKRCAQRQADCAARCGEGTKCRQHCVRSMEDCQAHCQRTGEARETARRQRPGPMLCMGQDGTPRKCSAQEVLEQRMAMREAAKLFCRDHNGEYSLCPEQREKLEKARRYLPKDCHETGCQGAGLE